MNKFMMIIKSFGAAFLLSLIVTAPSLATTPDGLTPNDELVCDVLKADGTSKGLYGLCVAYCEATDSPEDLTTEEKIAALPKPSSKLLANYNKKRNAGDPQMPCATYYDESACPAWTQDQINSIGTHVLSASEGTFQARDDDTGYDNGSYYSYIYDREYLFDTNVRGLHNIVQVWGYYGQRYGYFSDWEYDYVTNQYVRNNYNYISLTDAQYDACDAEIRSHVMPEQTP